MEQERDVYQIARTKEELTPRVPVMVAKHAKRSNMNIEKKILSQNLPPFPTSLSLIDGRQ